MTLNDVKITTTVLLPLLDATKDAFWMILPYLLGYLALRIGIWVAIALWRFLAKKA